MRYMKSLLLALACTACATGSGIASITPPVCTNVRSVQLYQGQVPGEDQYYEVTPDIDNGKNAKGYASLEWNYFNPPRGEVQVICDSVVQKPLPQTAKRCVLTDGSLTCE